MSGVKIKTALEKALERAAALPQVSPEKLDQLEYKPQGNHLAGKYLNNGADLASALKEVPAEKYPYVLEGIEETLLNNITLPADENAKKLSMKAFEGFFQIKEEQDKLIEIAGELEHFFNYYLQTLEQVKANVSARVRQKYQQVIQQLEAQYGYEVNINPENQPEFQKEYQQMIGNINERFEQALQGIKHKIKTIK